MSTTPLLLPRGEWERLCGRRGGAGAEEAARRALYVQSLDRASADMTKHWPNSLENMNRRLEEGRAARIQEAKDSNEKFYVEYVRRGKEEQARLMSRARDRLFQDRDAPKTLLRAVITCATLKERDLQLDFQRQLKDEEMELKRKSDDDILEKAKRWNEENKKRARARFLTNKEHQQFLSNQIKELSERARAEREETIRLEQQDHERGAQQMADIKDFEENYKLAERARIKTDIEQASAAVEQRRREENEREVLDERLREVYLQYKHRVDCRRASTEAEIQKEKLRLLEQISKKLETGDAARDAREQEILNKAVREKRECEDARLQADMRKAAELVEDRKKQRRKFLQDEEQRLHHESTMKTWGVLNRIRNTELTKELESIQKENEWQRTLKHREELLKLKAERDERDENEFLEQRYFYGALAEMQLREADAKLLHHAHLLREEARAAGQSTIPLDLAVEEYRRKFELYPARPLPVSQQEHFKGYAPEDRTKPEAFAVKTIPARPCDRPREESHLRQNEDLLPRAKPEWKLSTVRGTIMRR